MAIGQSNFAALLFPGLRKQFGNTYKDIQDQFTKVFDVRTSKKANEDDRQVTTLGLASTKDQGGSVVYDDPLQGWQKRYVHTTYGIGMVVTRELAEDELYGVINKMPRALARSVKHTIEIDCANILNNAFTSGTGGDGSYLCVSTHPLTGGGRGLTTFSNILSTAADLSVTSMEQAITDIRNWTDDRGLLIMAKPQKLVIPNELVFTARTILNSTQLPGTANNDINTMNGALPFVVMDYLTDADAWFMKTDVDDGLTFFWRRNPDFTRDNDFDTENAKYKATWRHSVGWTDPRGIFGTPGAA